MTRIMQSIIIQCPVEQVWGFLSNVENASRWDRGVLEAHQTSPGPTEVGATIQTQRQLLGRQRTGHYQVTAFEPLKKIALEAQMSGMSGTVCYAFDSVPEGTKLTAIAEIETKGLMVLISPFLNWSFQRDGNADLANIKRIMEAGTG